MISLKLLKPKVYQLSHTSSLTESIFSRYLFSQINYLGFLSLVFKSISVPPRPENTISRQLIVIQEQIKVLREFESSRSGPKPENATAREEMRPMISPVTLVNLHYVYQVIHQHFVLGNYFYSSPRFESHSRFFGNQSYYYSSEPRLESIPASSGAFGDSSFQPLRLETQLLRQEALLPIVGKPAVKFQLIYWYWNIFQMVLSPGWIASMTSVPEIRRYLMVSQLSNLPASFDIADFESKTRNFAPDQPAATLIWPNNGVYSRAYEHVGVMPRMFYRNTASKLAAQVFRRGLPATKEEAIDTVERNLAQSVLAGTISRDSGPQTAFNQKIGQFLNFPYHFIPGPDGQTGDVPISDGSNSNAGNTLTPMDDFHRSSSMPGPMGSIFDNKNLAAEPVDGNIKASNPPGFTASDTTRDQIYAPMEARQPGGDVATAGWLFSGTARDVGRVSNSLRWDQKLMNRRYFQKKYIQAFSLTRQNMTPFSAGIYASNASSPIFLSGHSFFVKGRMDGSKLRLALAMDAVPAGWARMIAFLYRDNVPIAVNSPEAIYPLAGMNSISQIINRDWVEVYSKFLNIRDMTVHQFLKPEFGGTFPRRFQQASRASVRVSRWNDSQNPIYIKTAMSHPSYVQGDLSPVFRMNHILNTGKWFLLARTLGPDVLKNYWEKQFDAPGRAIEFEWIVRQPRFANHLVSGSVNAAQNYIRRFPLVMIYPAGQRLEQFIRSFRELQGGIFADIDSIIHEHFSGWETVSGKTAQGIIAATSASENGFHPDSNFEPQLVKEKAGFQFWMPGRPALRVKKSQMHPADATVESGWMGVPCVSTKVDFLNPNRWDDHQFLHSAGYFTRKIREQIQQWTRYETMIGVTDSPFATLLSLEGRPFSLPDSELMEYLHQTPGDEDSKHERVRHKLGLDGDQPVLATAQSESMVANEGIRLEQIAGSHPEIFAQPALGSLGATVIRQPGFPGLGRLISTAGLDLMKGSRHVQKPLQTIQTLTTPPVQTAQKTVGTQEPGINSPVLFTDPVSGQVGREVNNEFQWISRMGGHPDKALTRGFKEMMLEFQKTSKDGKIEPPQSREPEAPTVPSLSEKESAGGNAKLMKQDIERIAEQVYYQIEKKLKFERQRMGM